MNKKNIIPIAIITIMIIAGFSGLVYYNFPQEINSNNTNLNAVSNPTPDIICNDINAKCISYCHKQVNGAYGDVYEQVWGYCANNKVFWITAIHLSATNGNVLGGDYPIYNKYSTTPGTYTGYASFSNPDHSSNLNNYYFYNYAPANRISSKSSSKFTMSLGVSKGAVSGGIGWSVSYPRYCQNIAADTETNAKWNYHDNQAMSGPDPTAVTFYAGAVVPLDKYTNQEVSIKDAGFFLHSSWWGFDVTQKEVTVSENVVSPCIQ